MDHPDSSRTPASAGARPRPTIGRLDPLLGATLVSLTLLGLGSGCGGGDPTAAGAPKADSAAPDRGELDQDPFPHVDGEAQAANPMVPQEPSPFRFEEISRTAGIDFDHVSGMTDERYYPSANASGVAIMDADGDGLMDLYFASCTLLPLGSSDLGGNRLYLNNGDGTYRDGTEASGLGFRGFNHGIVAHDFDGDGDTDVFLACYGPNRLYRNDGDGTFTDISESAGVENMGRTVVDRQADASGEIVESERALVNWASGGAAIDYDLDGDLDLYVAIHGDWRLPEDDKWCGFEDRGIRLYCSPRQIRTVKHVLFRNEGDLTFTDVTDEAGVGRADGHGFGVVAADLNADGLADLYVANDQNPNFLFLNKGDGTFTDATETSGAAFDIDGMAQSGMGVDAEDVDGDGLPDLFVTNFQNEYNTLYRNTGDGFFTDMTPFYGLSQDSRPWVGWGTALADFDSDGWPDCFVTNGHVDANHPDYEYEEPALLMSNVALGGDPTSRRFKLATRDAGPYFDAGHVGRGAAFGDLDDDGDLDIVVSHKDERPAILRNDTPRADRHWIRLLLTGTRSNRDAVGAIITAELGELTIHRQRKSGTSMLSTNDPRVLIGLGDAESIDRLAVRWPSGAETVLEDVPVDQDLAITEPEVEDTPADSSSD
ncbi:CRTAC1 family protein [Tautonia plasticadhaerens]|uniref:FG-GAP repeat protein n=1 Tax=Tautonia plasticadhaerens TaxID=2527974 RepID=A0A518HAT7_9BACT|nr:CRTAC1 family protein [Tautonia plasticadhaerens]QDV37968.1 FG-GAP repeat protein [Tautonia plasticadhaerens]